MLNGRVKRRGWDEVLDATHGAKAAEELPDALRLDFVLYLQPHGRDIHQSIIRGSAQQVGVLWVLQQVVQALPSELVWSPLCIGEKKQVNNKE